MLEAFWIKWDDKFQRSISSYVQEKESLVDHQHSTGGKALNVFDNTEDIIQHIRDDNLEGTLTVGGNLIVR